LDGIDELSDDDDYARELTWLPSRLPSHVKLIISSSTNSHTLDSIRSIYPEHKAQKKDFNEALSTFTYLEVPVLSSACVDAIIQHYMHLDQRDFLISQKQRFRQKALSSKMPIYIRTAWKLVFQKKTSGMRTGHVICTLDSETVIGLLEDVFLSLETQLGQIFVSRALGYLTASQQGLSKAEISDILSCDEDVMSEVFKFGDPAIRRVPPLLLTRLFEELEGCLKERQFYGVAAFFW
jgi:hypothetical protein